MSRHRLSSGQNILRGILVSVQMLAAVVAFEFADFQAKAGANMSAGVASLGTWKESVRNPQLAPIPGALVFEHRPELTEAGATDMLCEFVVLNHPTHVQIFDGENIEPAHQVSCQLVETVFPAIRNVSLMFGHLELLQPPTIAAFDTPGQDALQTAKLDSVLGGMSRICNPLASGKAGESIDSQVDPDLVSGLGEHGLGWFIQTKTHEVTPCTVLCYRNCGWRACETATPFDLETTDFGNCEVAIDRIPFETVDRVFRRLFAVLASERRVIGSLGKEIREGGLQVPQGLLLRHAGRLAQPSERRIATVLCQSSAAGVVIDWLAVFEAVCAELESEIIDVTGAAKLSRQLPSLSLGWIHSECQPCFQLQEHTTLC